MATPRKAGRAERPATQAASDASQAGRPASRLRVALRLQDYLAPRVALIERALGEAVPQADLPAARLFEAMRYSLLGAGKRLRAVLAIAACEAVGGRLEAALGLACALEMIHSYSMVHDDLPCMDDDDLRRGKPTNHKVYGEALATLAGDALLTDAFKMLARSGSGRVAPAVMLEVVAELADAAGSAGMVAGQTVDILSEGQPISPGQLEYLHARKTGALFLAAVRGGARLGGASPAKLKELSAYGRALGLAFQVVDDILDVEGSTEQVGKRTHKDDGRGKATYPALIGLERAREFARALERRALAALAGFDRRAEPLRAIASFVVERNL